MLCHLSVGSCTTKKRHYFSALWKLPAEKHEPLVSPLSIMGCLGLNTYCMFDCSWIREPCFLSTQGDRSSTHSWEKGEGKWSYASRGWGSWTFHYCLIKMWMSVCTMEQFSPKNRQGCVGRMGDRMEFCHCKKTTSIADSISDPKHCIVWLHCLFHS